MIITRTPFRVSFAGGGSDLKEYYRHYGGSVLSVSIDKYVYLSMHPYFYENRFFLKYSEIEYVERLEDIRHKIIRQVLSDYDIQGIDFNSSADIPSGTGLGSSSAFTAGLATLCNAYKGIYMGKEEIAKYACEVEIDKLHEPIGKQDQYACAVGGLNFISFHQNDRVEVEKILLPGEKLEQLEGNLMMFYLGGTRSASKILSEQKANTISNKKIENLHKMVALSRELRDELQAGNIDAMGEILHRGWMYKKELASGISNEKIDHYYAKAMESGAAGGKLLGAGGSGFLLFYVPEERHKEVRDALSDLKELPFRFDEEGTKVIYYN
ncbi:MAG: GHMP kinase [Epsilonproteobacteria bacterium]|nr:GHMP kinase [Campylobacterota bacterium]